MADQEQLSLTRGETARLRQYSYERQLEAGFKNPGHAGITFDRMRDERWVPKVEDPGVDSLSEEPRLDSMAEDPQSKITSR
jgi:hypothetical protein